MKNRALFSLAIAFTIAAPGPATTRAVPDTITLAGASSAEGIASGIGSSFFAGDLVLGDIYRGSTRSGSASLFIDAPDGRMAVGMKVDAERNLLIVAGGFTGQAFAYDARTGVDIAVVELADPALGTIINDVVVTDDAAWFTDSLQPVLHRVPIASDGTIGSPSTLTLSGPAANLTGPLFNLNGIAASPDGKALVVSHSGDGRLYRVDPRTGASAAITGAELPFVDGILVEGNRLWAVQNFLDRVVELRLGSDLSSAVVERVIRSSSFDVPASVAKVGGHLVVVNMHLDPETLEPRPDVSFDVVLVRA